MPDDFFGGSRSQFRWLYPLHMYYIAYLLFIVINDDILLLRRVYRRIATDLSTCLEVARCQLFSPRVTVVTFYSR